MLGSAGHTADKHPGSHGNRLRVWGTGVLLNFDTVNVRNVLNSFAKPHTTPKPEFSVQSVSKAL